LSNSCQAASVLEQQQSSSLNTGPETSQADGVLEQQQYSRQQIKYWISRSQAARILEQQQCSS